MNKHISKFVFATLLLSFLCAVSAVSAFAENDASLLDVTKSTLSIEYLGKDDAPAASDQGSPGFSKSDAQASTKFWIGVAADNLDKFELFTKGVYSFEISFDYDNTFVRPTFVPSGDDISNNQAWNSAIKSANTEWNSDLYDIVSVRTSDINTNSNREDPQTAVSRRDSGNWKMCTVCVRAKAGADFSAARFKNIASADKQYLIKLPFILVGAPNEEDADQNPIVLSLDRGPETFDIGSDSDGTSPQASWKASLDAPFDNLSNLKSIFDFKGDISLFGDSGITNIIPLYSDDLPDSPHSLTLYHSFDADAQSGFNKVVKEYYLTVPADVDRIQLKIFASSSPSISVNSSPVNSSLSDDAFLSDPFSLLPIDLSSKIIDHGFCNSISINSDSFIIHVRKLLHPSLSLDFGNGPYGRIMQDTSLVVPDDDDATAANIAAAKAEFDSKKTYDSPFSPGTKIKYVADEYDKDDYIYFKTLKTAARDAPIEDTVLVDPGFTAYNSYGDEIPHADVTRKMTVRKFNRYTFLKDGETGVTSETFTHTGDENFTEVTNNSKIVPDVYDMIYSFYDYDGTEKSFVRKIGILYELGDVDLSLAVNANDITSLTNHVSGAEKKSDLPFYVSRIVDVDYSTALNANDITDLRNHVSGARTFSPRYAN